MKPPPHRTVEPRFFATAAKGTEPLLRDELRELGLPLVRADRGGVQFGAEPRHAFVACLWSRIALRILSPIAEFPCPDEDALYDGVREVDWSRWIDARRTLLVRAACRSSRLTHTQYISQRSKDAIVDQLRDRTGSRPDVARESPDLLLFVHLVKDRATVYLDYGGDSLHEHGFRHQSGVAPLRETLAAALVRFSGWDRQSPLTDPMCGSGTLLIEAGLWAAQRAPGISRQFGFERWLDFDAERQRELAQLRQAARETARQDTPVTLFGSDSDASVLELARANAARVGLRLELRAAPLRVVNPQSEQGTLVTNPPYGQRLAEGPEQRRELENVLRRFAGQQRALIVPQDYPSTLRPDRYLAVFNGNLACEFRRYEARRETAHRSSES
ncbi:MAG TPA: THUMP domain-containing protein [Polyangiaceae bacterium]|nr:THUMP domain-containing protein [Polyangiaceae bacterium]